MREPAGGSEAGRKILEVLAAGPEGASPEERAERERLIREILEKKHEGSETAKKE